MPSNGARMGETSHTFGRPEGLLSHYTDAAAVFEHILPEHRLRMSPYRKMRDPVESQDVMPVISWFGDRPGEDVAPWAVLADVKTARDAMRVLAFSRDAGDGAGLRHPAFDCSWARPRMWEQYSDNHTGACLLFDRGRLEATLRNDLGPSRVYIGDVDYDREGIAASPVQHMTDERIFDPAQRRQAVADHIDNYQPRLLLPQERRFRDGGRVPSGDQERRRAASRLHDRRRGLCLHRLRRCARRRRAGAEVPAVATNWSA